MLVNLNALLKDAKEKKYAIPAFDISNFEMMKAVLDICETERSPAILMGLVPDLNGRRLNLLTAMVKSCADFYKIPVCFQLDHATDLGFIESAIKAGFSSVMFDGSSLPFDQNAKFSAEVVKAAHRYNVTVEAELGHVGNALVGNEADPIKNDNPEDTLTDPNDVVNFLNIAEVDALAVAIGTAHGVYQKTPTLRIDRLDKIESVCNIPLVLHGGSGTPSDQIDTAIKHGITKINIYSDVVSALNRGLRNKLDSITNIATWPAYVFEESRKLMKDVITEKIRSFGSNNRA